MVPRARVRAALGLIVVRTLVPAAVVTFASSQQKRDSGDSLDLVLGRAAVAVESFERAFAAVVAEERLEQRTTTASSFGQSTRIDSTRVTRSDFLLVRLPNRDNWLPFRDVFELNGQPVRERSERLQRLFVDSPQTALTDAARINEESSRYNIGAVVRTINLPTFGLMLLRPVYQQRFAFKKAGDESINGVVTWRVAFVERLRPALVKTLRGQDVPIEGSVWIEPRSGRVVKTLVKTRGTPDPGGFAPPASGETLMRVEVKFAPSDGLGLWVPETMTEWAMAPNRAVVSAVATYSKFRRFEVKTTERFER